MVITAQRGPALSVPMAGETPAGVESRHQVLQCSSLKIPKAWGSKRLLGFLNVNGKGELVTGGWGSVVVGSQGSDDRQPQVRSREAKAEAVAEGDGRWFEEEGRGELHVEGERRWTGASEEGEVKRAEEEEDDGGFDEVRAKLMLHLREAANRVQPAVGPKKEGEVEPEPETEPAPCSAAAEATMPWNLRARTAARRVIRYGYEPEGVVQRGGPVKPARQRSWDAARSSARPRFSISLSTEEIAEDIYAVTGSLPRRRPRKRARAVQRQLDALFPGSWLTEITADSYKVAD